MFGMGVSAARKNTVTSTPDESADDDFAGVKVWLGESTFFYL